LLIVLMYGGVIVAGLKSVDLKKIQVIDESGSFVGKFKNSESFNFEFIKKDINNAKKDLQNSKSDALVFIPKNILDNAKGVKIFSENSVTVELQSSVEKIIEKEIETIKLTNAGIKLDILESSKMNVSSETINIKEGGESKSSSIAATAIGYICAFLIYMSVFIFGAQVMRSITEEKTSRIVEILISSVKPFQLMIGKIVGVAMVGLTQFILWIVLSFGVITAIGTVFSEKLSGVQKTMSSTQMASLPPEAQEMAKKQMSGGSMISTVAPELFSALSTLPIATIIISFLFYFLGGYLLYSSLFGAVGSAVDSETDTQQFMLPITLPIIAAFMIAQFVIRDPNSSLAFWTSMIPFTSPIIMMVRIPFGVPTWQIILSIVLLIGGFIFTTWIASRIYRVGILMYGKKVTWKELGKWIFYKA
jgi:ABC-2 type transport system permease protein